MSDKKASAVEVKKIILKVGDKSLELPIEEARELQRVLAELFGQPETKVVHEHDYWTPRWWLLYPPYTTPPSWIPCSSPTTDGTLTTNGTMTITALNSSAKLLDS